MAHDLIQLAQKLVIKGPHKFQPTPRRVRGLFNGSYAFDTTNAYHVWEHPNYPQYYIPISSLTPAATLSKTANIDGTSGAAHLGRLTVGNLATDRVIVFNTKDLRDLIRIEFRALDHWFEEDVPIYVHPKDPFKRIDVLNSTRTVKVALDGVVLAESSNPVFLLETTLRTRYYLPPTSVAWKYLSKSDTETYCPYKGKANYYDVTVGGKVYRDLVWYYTYPTTESTGIAGHLCFWNEKVDIWVGGEKEER